MPTFYEKQLHLRQLAVRAEASYALARRSAERLGQRVAVRHKCFVSYHGADIDAVTRFVEDFNDVFIPRVLGASESDHFGVPVDSQDEEYIKGQIGSKYLSDSSVTLLFVGRCTWARKFIDWEISSSLRDDPVNRRNGLMAITPSDRSRNPLPARFRDNWPSAESGSYARYYFYPATGSSLRACIQDAFDARTNRAHLIDNTRRLRTYDAAC